MNIKRISEAIWIEKRKRWQINVQREGIRKTFTSSIEGRKGKHESEAKADKWLSTFASDQRIYDAVDLFVEDKGAVVQRQSHYAYCEFLKIVKEYFSPSKRLSVVSVYDWQKLLNHFAIGKKESTVQRFKGIIQQFTLYCTNRNWDVIQVTDGKLKIPDYVSPASQKQALTPAQVSALLALDPQQHNHANIFKLAVLTGMRRSELLGLQFTDISDKYITIQRTRSLDGISERGKTANALRRVPLTDAAKAVIESQRQIALPSDEHWMFPSPMLNKPLSAAMIDKAWEHISKSIGTNATVHELRHTFISVIQADIPEALLKQIVGHSASLDTYAIYGHQTEKDIEQTKSILSTAFDKYK